MTKRIVDAVVQPMASSKPKQLESRLQATLKKDVKHLFPNSFYHKLTDSIRTRETRFIPEKPFDIFMVNESKPYAIETKVHKKHTKFSITKTTRNQIKHLLEFQKSCNQCRQAFLLINVKYNIEERKVNYLIYFYPDEISESMKSIDIKGLDNPDRVILREKIDGKTVWNLQKIIK